MTLLVTLLATFLVKDVVPQPIYAADTSLVNLYYTAWEMAQDQIRHDSGLASPVYMDEGCMDKNGPKTIWIWDTALMSLYCKYAPDYFPGVESLRNFYAPILDDKPSPLSIHHPDNPPLFAWVEYENFKFTADRHHLDTLFLRDKYLQRYYDYFNNLDNTTKFGFKHRPVALENCGIGFKWSGNQSGMDNTPRARVGEILWVDAISQQALAALYISRLADQCSDRKTAKIFRKEYLRLKDIVNKYYWDDEDGCYYDIHLADSSVTKILTVGSFWPMMAEIPSMDQARRMASFALADNRLGGEYPWKSLNAEDPDYFAAGGKYWCGGIWLPTAYMGIKALEKYGFRSLADQTAERLLNQMNRTYLNYEPHSIWECYNPSADTPANSKRKPVVRKDFCGWSALGPISLFIENIIGIYEVDAVKRIVKWNIHHEFEHGLKNLKFGDINADMIYSDGEIKITTNKQFTLIVGNKKFRVKSGVSTLKL